MGNSFAIEKWGFQVLTQLVCLLNFATSTTSFCSFSESAPISSTATNFSVSRFSGATEQFSVNLNDVYLYAFEDEHLVLHFACPVDPKLPQRTLGNVDNIILFNGTSIQNESFTPFDMTCTDAGVSVLLQNVQKKDAGIITHLVYLNGTFLLARSIFFNVISKPLKYRTPYRVFIGKTISLQCLVNTSNVRWNFVTGTKSVYVGSGGTLRIENASKEHSGWYQCSVSRPVGRPIVYAEKRVEVVAEGNATLVPTVKSNTTSAYANNTQPTSAFTMQPVTSMSPTSSPRGGESSDSDLALILAPSLVLGVGAAVAILVAILAVKKRFCFSRCDRSFSPDSNGPDPDKTRVDLRVLEKEIGVIRQLHLTTIKKVDETKEEVRIQGALSRQCAMETADTTGDKK